MTLTFPSNPTLNQETTTGGRTYRWTGQAWALVGSGIPGPTGPTGPASTVAGPTGPTGGGGGGGPAVVVTTTALNPDSSTTGYNPGAGDIYRLAVTGTTGARIQNLGITGVDGDAKLFINVGATAPITLHHATGPNANARFAVPWAGDYVMSANGGAALVVYDSTSQVWRVV
jgi:hypothetical protein